MTSPNRQPPAATSPTAGTCTPRGTAGLAVRATVVRALCRGTAACAG